MHKLTNAARQIVRGRGDETSLDPASHGAGRRLSRTAAKNSITWSEVNNAVKDNGIALIGRGLDEAPVAYKDIRRVMDYQKDLVDIVGTFSPKIMRMDDAK